MPTRERELLSDWLYSLVKIGLAVNSISSYEQSFLHFREFLLTNGLELDSVQPSHVSDFVLDCFVRGNGRETIRHYVDCVRQFYVYHREELKVSPEIFNLRVVRVAYDCFLKAGISRDRRRRKGLAAGEGKIIPKDKLKANHARFHPRG